MGNKQIIKGKKDQLIEMTAMFCSEYVNDEYRLLSEKLISKLARKRSVPFLTGRLEIWAGSIVYTLGSLNFLFDRAFEPYVTTDSLCDYFGTSKSTVGQKSKKIRDMLKIGYYDAEFSTQHMAENNPLSRMALVDGYIVRI